MSTLVTCMALVNPAAMRGVRLAQLTGIQNGLDLAVIRAIAAHKADLHQIPAGGLLIADDLGAVRLGGCQRLFAEYRLAGDDGLAGYLGMNAVPCGDNSAVDLLVSRLRCS